MHKVHDDHDHDHRVTDSDMNHVEVHKLLKPFLQIFIYNVGLIYSLKTMHTMSIIIRVVKSISLSAIVVICSQNTLNFLKKIQAPYSGSKVMAGQAPVRSL